MQSILDFGVRLVVGMQGLGAWPTQPMQFFSLLGTEDFFVVALPILYWCVDSMLGLRVAVILLIGTNINAAFKLALHGPRPYWYSPQVRTLATESSFGVPSSHAQNAATIWGLLAATLRKWWGWLAAVLLIFLIGLSRLYLGVHFPQDVLLGWLIGGLFLWLALRCWDPIFAWTKKIACQPAGSGGLPGLFVDVAGTGYTLPMVKSHKLAAAAGLGHVRDTGTYIVGCSDHGRVILRDVGWGGLDGCSRRFRGQRPMVETCLALFAGYSGCFIHPVRLEIDLSQRRERAGVFLRLSALHGDWFLGNRWRAMDIYSGQTDRKAAHSHH
jgi:membrane-associated phospholipid phosphatase